MWSRKHRLSRIEGGRTNHYGRISLRVSPADLKAYSRDGLGEIIELPTHPWFVATQFHPEFTSTPRDGHPLFTGFVQAARAYRGSQLPAAAGA